jgi:hypothetical protein
MPLIQRENLPINECHELVHDPGNFRGAELLPNDTHQLANGRILPTLRGWHNGQ